MVRAQRTVFECNRAAARARSLSVSHALQPGHRTRRRRRAEALVHRPPTRAPRGGCSPSHFHLFRGTHRRRYGSNYVFSQGDRSRLCALDADTGRSLFRCDRRQAGDVRRFPAPRPVRALQHRGARDHANRRSVRSRTISAIRRAGWRGRVITAYRPDPVVDPEHEGFQTALDRISASSPAQDV